MKKTIIAAIFTLLFAVQAQVENVAKEVLEAYKTKNVEMLKKNASGMVRHTINENYFEDKSIKKSMEPVAEWDGKIKEIRFDSDNIMGNFVVVAAAYYSDHSEEEINAVMLSTMDGKNWVFVGSGLETVPKVDFLKLSATVPEPPKKEVKTDKPVKPKLKMNIELASGDQFENVNEAKLVESFNSMDDDNFYMILSSKNDFVQAAYSDGNYVVEFSDGGVQYEANKVLSKETALNLLKKYLLGESDWREGVEWVKK
jgi:hypothetical protein